MVSKEVCIKKVAGFESKYAAKFIQKASGFQSEVWIEMDGRRANAKSLLGLLSLGIGRGMKVVIIAEGMDEAKAVDELEEFLNIDSAAN